jgi:hypothetical protein
MARKFFLASVGNAEAYATRNGEFAHVLSARTLTESTLGFTSSMEEVRAGQGAKLYGRFNHSAGMTVSLTDAMFDMNYIALQTGSQIQTGASAIYSKDSYTAVTGATKTIALTKEPVAIGTACGLDKKVVWFRASGCNPTQEDISIVIDGTDNTYDGGNLTIGATDATKFVDGVTYCISYFAMDNLADLLKISANFIPAEMVLVLTAKLFEGDANAPETGKPAGEITIKVPRFQLDGQFDLSMAMTSAATIALNGTALAVDAGGCEDDGIYAEIVQVLNGSTYASKGIRMIAIDPESAVADQTPVVYGLYGNGSTGLIPNSDLTFAPALSEGKFAANTYNVSLTEIPSIKDTVTISG